MRDAHPSGGALAIPSSALTMGRGQRLTWVVAVMVSLSIAAFVVFGVAKSTAQLGENSPLARQYTDVPPAQTTSRQATFDSTWGSDGGTTTLVLYDTDGTESEIEDAETQAIVAGNLATHFGTVRAVPMADYVAGDMAKYDGVVYVGATSAGTVSPAFHEDMLNSQVPVLWAGDNIADVSASSPLLHERFMAAYGWDPVASAESGPEEINGITYKDHDLTREGSVTGPITVPRILDKDRVDVLATTTNETAQPWAIRSGNLTYIGENPLSYVDESDRYLAFADLYYDLLAPDTQVLRQAAVRLEDVDAAANPEDLRAITDFFAERNIPFQVAVIPIRISRSSEEGSDSWIGLSLADRPDVVKELRYMTEHGGTLIQHGTTHQFGELDNPYNASSGADFEFYRTQCSATAVPPLEIEPCRNDSYIVDTGPLGTDTVDGWIKRLEEGRQVFRDLDLGEVTVFETPHYLASSNAYAAMAEVYEYRYERSHYFPGQLSNDEAPYMRPMDQFFPYTVNDIYGSKVIPENLGNITEEEQNNHAVRDPAFIVKGAKANLAVRESTASFFYHPFLGVEQLEETVNGIEDLGYTFVSATDLK